MTPKKIPLLRLLLLTTSLLLTIFPWLPNSTEFSGNEVSLGLLAAVTTPVVWMLLLLDAMMLAIYLEGSDDPAQNLLWRRLIRYNLALAALIVASWIPFFLRLNS